MGVDLTSLSQLDYIHMARDDRPHRIKTPAIVELDDSIKEGLEEKFLSSMGEDVLELVELVLTDLD